MSNTEIDINLYDRQIRTYGTEAVKMMASSSITIIGLEGGLGTEIAKNLALGGVKTINLYDNNLVNEKDLECGYYYSPINISRSEQLKPKIQELNQYVNIEVIDNKDKIDKNSILIFVNQLPDFIKEFDSCKMVVVFSKGCAGSVFVNAGTEHIVNDIMGENIEPVQIGSIDSVGKVLCAEHHSHNYQNGDFIKFTNLEGTNINIFDKEFKVKVISPTCFQLVDFQENKDFTFLNGTAIFIKKPITIHHKKFSEILTNPTFNFSFDDSELIFDTLITYFNSKDMNSSEIYKGNSEKVNLAKTFRYDLMPVVSLMGSIAASETVKLITHKYLPINQIWCWYDKNLIPTKEIKELGESTLGKLYGKEFEKSMKESDWFVVGSGAIGCELLKNLAFLGTGTIYITDPDNIEKSNLNRQFLFRPNHIGNPKSKTASEVITKMKPNVKIIPYTEKVSKSNQNFTDEVMKKVDGVLNALDNIEARKYMDEQCFHKSLPLFESGTTGTKGNTQPVIPFITETYSNSADPPQEKSFPMCTIKNFPNEIQHTIVWAMDFFELFNRAPLNVNKWIKNNNVFHDTRLIENFQGKEDVMNFLIKMNIKTFEDCVYRAVDMFYENYRNQIVQLLTTYPADKVIDEKPFWSSGKRMPTPIDFDINNDHHLDYVEATAHLISRCYKLKDESDFNRERIKDIVSKYNYVDNFKPDSNLKIASKDSELEQSKVNLEITLPDNKEYENIELTNQEFEKDDDSNWHVAWVTSASNLRAINYSIPPATKQETKGIAGRIIPAIATTTSVVSGLIIIEMIKYMLAKNNLIENKVENYRSTFVNLADTNLVYSEPMPAPTMKIANTTFNSWDKFIYNQDSTLEEFKKYWEDKFKTTISMIVYDNALLYSNFIDSSENITRKLSDLVKEKNDEVILVNGVIIVIASEDDDLNLPEIQFIFN